MHNKKKTLSTVLTTLTISAMVVTGCSSNSGNENVKSNNDGNKGTGSEATSTPKEVGYPEKVSYWVGLNGNAGATMKDYNGIAAYKELEKITGTKVEFQHPPTGQEKDQFNLMIASGKMPDVIEYTWSAAPKGADSLIKEKRIIRLNELIEENAPNLTKVLNDNPEFRKMITTDEGNIYVMPFLLGDPMLSVFYGPVLRGDWLENLNLEVPKTVSEWETVLTAFRDQDPNKNGEKDEIPYLFEIGALDTGQLFLGAWGIMSDFYQVDGKVNYGPIQPEFKEFLATMARWYKDGLIDKEYPTTIDAKLKDAKVTGNRLGSLSTYPGSGIGRYTDLMKGDIPEVSFIGAPYPTLDGGDNAIGFYSHPFRTIGAAISTSAKNPEEIVKWLDYKYGEEGHMLFNFGIEGDSYEMVDGYPKYTDKILKNPDGLPVTQAMAQNFVASWSGPIVQDKRYLEQYLQLDTQKEAQKTWAQADHSKLMPPVTLTADESSKVSSIMNDVKTYRDEMINRFIMGEEPIDNFDKFVDTINKMNIDDAIAAQQAALDRYKNR